MESLPHIWRPSQQIRVKALGLPFQHGKLLVAAVFDDEKTIAGWRPLGGNIEFGEPSEEALIRELKEELDADARILQHLATFENIFSHHGETGHEIIFAYEIAFLDPGRAKANEFVVEEGDQRFQAAWIPLTAFHTQRERLLPESLLPLVPAERAT